VTRVLTSCVLEVTALAADLSSGAPKQYTNPSQSSKQLVSEVFLRPNARSIALAMQANAPLNFSNGANDFNDLAGKRATDAPVKKCLAHMLIWPSNIPELGFC